MKAIPLAVGRVQAGESWWTLESDEVQIMLPKDDAYFWKGLFEGGEEKSHYEACGTLHNSIPTSHDEF